jgi:hypothetical protein
MVEVGGARPTSTTSFTYHHSLRDQRRRYSSEKNAGKREVEPFFYGEVPGFREDCYFQSHSSSAEKRRAENLSAQLLEWLARASQSQKRLSKEDRSLRFALCARRSASLSFFCVLHPGRIGSCTRTRSRDQKAIFQAYYSAKRPGDLLDRRSFQSNRRRSGLVSRRFQG